MMDLLSTMAIDMPKGRLISVWIAYLLLLKEMVCLEM